MKNLITVAVLVGTLSATIAAQSFTKPAPLQSVLNSLRDYYGIEIVYDSPVTGDYAGGTFIGKTPEQALTKVLGSRYSFVYIEGKYRIRQAGSTPHSSPARSMTPTGINRNYLNQYYRDPGASVRARLNAAYGHNPHYGNPYYYGGGYYYGPRIAREWRKFEVENDHGAFRINGGVSERRLQLMDVYVDGCYRDVASKLNNFKNGKVGLTAGHHRIEVVDTDGFGLGYDVTVEPKAVTETFKTQHFNIRVDEARLLAGYKKMPCQNPTATPAP